MVRSLPRRRHLRPAPVRLVHPRVAGGRDARLAGAGPDDGRGRLRRVRLRHVARGRGDTSLRIGRARRDLRLLRGGWEPDSRRASRHEARQRDTLRSVVDSPQAVGRTALPSPVDGVPIGAASTLTGCRRGEACRAHRSPLSALTSSMARDGEPWSNRLPASRPPPSCGRCARSRLFGSLAADSASCAALRHPGSTHHEAASAR